MILLNASLLERETYFFPHTPQIAAHPKTGLRTRLPPHAPTLTCRTPILAQVARYARRTRAVPRHRLTGAAVLALTHLVMRKMVRHENIKENLLLMFFKVCKAKVLSF